MGENLPLTGWAPGALVTKIHHIAGDILENFLPHLCLVCAEPAGPERGLCAACREAVSFIRAPLCHRCGVPLSRSRGGASVCAACRNRQGSLDERRAVFLYDPASRPLVLAFKYGDRLDAAPVYGGWMAAAGADLLARCDIMIPVPLHWRRLWRRRYNQAAVLARSVARRCAKPVCCDALVRHRATAPQIAMSPAQRRANVARAFSLRPKRISLVKGRRVLLIDDVATSGATAQACARILKKAGVRRVDLLTLALAKPGNRQSA